MFLSGLDETDRQIVGHLIHNARISYSELGERVGLSRVAVKARMAALEKQGVIEEYTAIINPQKLNGAISCYFEIETEPSAFQGITEALEQNETVTQVYLVSGSQKLHVHAVAASQEELEGFLKNTLYGLAGIRSLSCNIILSRIKDIKGLRL